jgi:hypothetical protein
MACHQIFDKHFCVMSFLSATEDRAVQNDEAKTLMVDLKNAGMVSWDGQIGRLLPDGESALQDYRDLGADV